MSTNMVVTDADVDAVLRFFKAKRWSVRAPLKSSFNWEERHLARLFAGTNRIDAYEALVRGLTIIDLWYSPDWVGETLKWGYRQGLVGFSEASGNPEWTLLRHGVTFVPHDGGSIDVRTSSGRIGSYSTATAIAMEVKRRARRDAKDLQKANREIIRSLSGIDPRMPLTDDLMTADLPPVATVGALLHNFESFGRDLPLHRARQIVLQLVGLRWPHECPSNEVPPAAPELDDFEL